MQGETMEMKVERIMENKEPVKDGAPLLFTEKKDGVIAGYNIRADRWEIAAESMDSITSSSIAKREQLAYDKKEKEKAEAETKVINISETKPSETKE